MAIKEKFLQRIAVKAAESPEFRANFYGKSKSMMEKNQGKLPENMEVVVLEDSPDKIHIVLPSPRRNVRNGNSLPFPAVSAGIRRGSCGCNLIPFTGFPLPGF
jgi:hypothetical protein